MNETGCYYKNIVELLLNVEYQREKKIASESDGDIMPLSFIRSYWMRQRQTMSIYDLLKSKLTRPYL